MVTRVKPRSGMRSGYRSIIESKDRMDRIIECHRSESVAPLRRIRAIVLEILFCENTPKR